MLPSRALLWHAYEPITLPGTGRPLVAWTRTAGVGAGPGHGDVPA